MVRTIAFFGGLGIAIWFSIATHNNLIGVFYLIGIVIGAVLQKYADQ